MPTPNKPIKLVNRKPTIKLKNNSGKTGPAGEIIIGDTTTLAPNTDATVINVGTNTHAVLEFGIPQGIQGDPATNLITSVNGEQGVVVLDAADVGADAAGSASNALSQANDYTDEQIGDLATVASTGSYNDLLNKPTIPNITGKADKTYVDAQDAALQADIDTKVDKVTGKQLSTEDYTTAEKTKLAGIETGAQVNTVTSVAGKTGAVTLVKGDVGLGNVDNTSDASKPVSTATQTALDGKRNLVATPTSVYTTNSAGNEASLPYTAGVTANTVVTRDTNGNTSAATPTSSAHLTTKAYVDTADALKVNKAGDTMTGILSNIGISLPFRHQRSATGDISMGTGNSNNFIVVENVGAVRILDVQAGRLHIGDNTKPAIIHGTGFPNGVISAPVGSIYIDTAVTNGASSWIKKSGTGNTGWQVLEGDTGWRNVSSMFAGLFDVVNPLDYGVQWRRIGLLGYYRMRSSLSRTSSSAQVLGSELWTNTTGSTVRAFVQGSTTKVVDLIFQSDAVFPVNGAAVVGDRLGFTLTYSMTFANSGSWPTTLPGTPV